MGVERVQERTPPAPPPSELWDLKHCREEKRQAHKDIHSGEGRGTDTSRPHPCKMAWGVEVTEENAETP